MSAKAPQRRSTCPINASLELLGDRWSLLIVRDLVFAGLRTYKEFLNGEEAIATNILADRLTSLQAAGLITSERDPDDGRKLVYRLTPKGFDLAPALLELGRWAVKYEAGVRRPEPLRLWEADRDAFLGRLRKERLHDQPKAASPSGTDNEPAPDRPRRKLGRTR
ncbi:MAG TPA: helix-turn-helix domain-containing protein [Polyangiaceae bacterium]|nr:helix-turn-helix domain-containing protein [Polyangiaceae bacterium]